MINKPCSNYGTKIQTIRERLGITRSQLALMTETNETMVINLEKSIVHPTDYFIDKVAIALNLSPFELKNYIWCDQEMEECGITNNL